MRKIFNNHKPLVKIKKIDLFKSQVYNSFVCNIGFQKKTVVCYILFSCVVVTNIVSFYSMLTLCFLLTVSFVLVYLRNEFLGTKDTFFFENSGNSFTIV